MFIQVLGVFAIICVALVVGRQCSKIKLPAILGWLITGVVFGPFLVGIVSHETMEAKWYEIAVKIFECMAGVMIGKEIVFKKIAKSGKQIIGITFMQSIVTFLFVSLVFALALYLMKLPMYVGFIFGGIALATAPAPAISIVNEYKTKGAVTRTLIPLAAIDDVIGIIVFFGVMSVVTITKGNASVSPLVLVGIVLLPFVIGIVIALITSLIIKKIKNKYVCFGVLITFLALAAATGLLVDLFVFKGFKLNYLLIGMAFSATAANLISEEKFDDTMKLYQPILGFSLVVVIVNLGLPLDYRLIAGAGLFTLIYIVARAIGKIGGAFLGGKLTKAEPTVTKYLGFTLLPHSGVSLVFTGIAVASMVAIDENLANIIQGTIVAAAIINEVIAVITAKIAFKLAGEIPSDGKKTKMKFFRRKIENENNQENTLEGYSDCNDGKEGK